MHKGFIISLLLLWQAYPSYAGMSVFFTPSDKCEISIIGEINKAEENIDAAVYAINNQDIVDALKDAHRRGVKIRILTDRLQASQKKSKVRELHDFGINIRVNSKHKIEHNKFAVFCRRFFKKKAMLLARGAIKACLVVANVVTLHINYVNRKLCRLITL